MWRLFRYLTSREQKLHNRRRNAEELLAWKQRLDEEEQEVFTLEKQALSVWGDERGPQGGAAGKQDRPPSRRGRPRSSQQDETTSKKGGCGEVVHWMEVSSLVSESLMSHWPALCEPSWSQQTCDVRSLSLEESLREFDSNTLENRKCSQHTCHNDVHYVAVVSKDAGAAHRDETTISEQLSTARDESGSRARGTSFTQKSDAISTQISATRTERSEKRSRGERSRSPAASGSEGSIPEEIPARSDEGSTSSPEKK